MSAVVAMLPTPYTADQIREAFQPGLKVAFELTQGGETSRQDWLVTAATDDTVTIRFTSPEGTEERTSSFEDLRKHAEFPSQAATRSESTWTCALGDLSGWTYVVTDGPKVSTFHFSAAHPGPPVLMTVKAGGAEVFRMEMVERGKNE